ncbi:MAG: YdiU family protein [Sulfuriferula sp.]|nr:YdiU family protein [Sulfuriferula sp.]
MPTLDKLNFSNRYTSLPAFFYRPVTPSPIPDAYLLHFNHSAAKLADIALDPESCNITDLLCGNALPTGAEAIATLYAGHQFGQYVPQLGDGRAILLGGIEHEGNYWELQLKGAGTTPYSRNGDGRAVLRSSIREYLCSEAMHGLGIPTTRALSLIGSSLPVYRESVETAAIVMRMSPSFIRFGSFEIFFHRNQPEAIRTLADYTIQHHYAELRDTADKYPRFLQAVVASTAKLMAQWQSVGFAHGVMNTDNMSILGLTLDYGPFGFLDHYDPHFICNHSDHAGRYAFDQQPDVAAWNLTRLAQALSPLMSTEDAKAALGIYPAVFASTYIDIMCAKLGLSADKSRIPLIMQLLDILHKNRVDYTIFMRKLSDFDSASDAINAPLRDLFTDRSAFDTWAITYRNLLNASKSNDNERALTMRRVNPKYILRNYLAENAIIAARDHNDTSEIERLMQVLQQPYDEHPGMETYAAPPPDWAQHISVSCSS